MATQKITVELPESVFQQLARIAQLTSQSLEVLAAQSIASNLPPSADNAPLEIQAELLKIQTLPIEQLLEIANGNIVSTQQQRHYQLLEKNQTDAMTSQERQELRELSLEADRLMLRKAYAWSILRWRGYRIPSLEELPAD